MHVNKDILIQINFPNIVLNVTLLVKHVLTIKIIVQVVTKTIIGSMKKMKIILVHVFVKRIM